MKRFAIYLLLSFCMLFPLSEAHSQVTPQYTFTNANPNSGNSIPLGGGTWADQRNQWLYLPGDFGSSVPGGMAISKIYVRASGTYSASTYTDFEVSLGQNPNTTGLTTVWETGLTLVMDEPTFSAGPTVADQWIEIELETPFPFNPNDPLIVETIQTATSGGIALRADGTPVNPIYTGNTQNYGSSSAATPTTRRYSYQFGFDLVSLVPDNAGVVAIDSPSVFCAGTKDIYATIGNFGINQIDSVEVFWEFNGVLQPRIMYNNLLDTMNGTNPHTVQIYLGTETFASGVANDIKVWVANPNGVADTINSNDTLEVTRKAALVGSYTIDPALPAGSGNYQSFSSLANELNAYGICGDIKVTVAQGQYNDYFQLFNVPGSDSLYHITIDGLDSSDVLLTHNGSQSYATLTLANQNNVTVKNMTIESTGSNSGVAVILAGKSHNNVISNNVLKVNTSSTSSNVSNVLFSGSSTSNSTGSQASYNILSNNRMLGGYYGVRMYASSASVGVHNQIVNNEMSDMYYYGIYAYYQDSAEIIGNTIDMTDRGNINAYGAMIYYTSNGLLHDNYIHAGSYGLYYYNYSTYSPATRKISIVNNMLISDNNIALYMYYTDNVDIFHNSVSTRGVASIAAQIYSSSSIPITGYDVRNNIFSAVYGYAFASNMLDTIFSRLDYNIYYSKGDLFEINTTVYPDLAAYKLTNPVLNLLSLEGNPQFSDPGADLHIIGALANDAGDNTVGVNHDIDDDPRPMTGSSIVDIGADEYDAPNCPPPFGLLAYNPVLDSITLEWTGTGTDYQIELVQKGASQGTGDSIIVNANSIRLGGLTASTNYEYYVRMVCNRGDSSIWWGPMEFSTADTVSYLEDFENFELGGLSNGWYSSTFLPPTWKADKVALSSNGYEYGGPVEDHTIGAGGTFAYLSVDNNAGSSNLYSVPIYMDTNSTMEFSFWYHMYGADMGTLNVYADTNGTSNFITSISGQQQLSANDPWLEFSTYLTGYQGKYVQLRFEGSKGTGYYSAMAIDDVSLDTVPTFSAGVVELLSPSGAVCAGSFAPVVGVRNLGIEELDSVKILWEINGVLMDSVMYSTSILSGDTAAVSLGNFTFNGSTIYDVKIYTKDPNSTADPIPADDTLSLIMRTGLSGNYTIDPSLPASVTNFLDFQSAANTLNMYGVCGPTIIEAEHGTYNGAVELNFIDGASSTNTITFDGVDSSLTIVSHDGSDALATWTLDGAEYVTIKNLTVENTSTGSSGKGGAGGATVLFKDANYNTVSNSQLLADNTSSSSSIKNVVFSGDASTGSGTNANSNYNTIANNRIDGGYYGVWQYALNTNIDVGNRIVENEFSKPYYYGIYSLYQDSLEIIGNTIDGMRNASAYGVMVYYTNNSLIQQNYIHSGYYGIYYYNYSTYAPANRPIEISNNMIISDQYYGIYMYYVETANIYHNSVSVSSNANPAIQIYSSTAIPMSNYDVRNNIFSASTGVAMRTNMPITMFANWDNNAYYSEGSTLFTIDGTDYTDLASLNAAVPSFNINSIEGNPQFETPTDLHIIGSFVNDQGDNNIGLVVDIEGDIRPMGTNVDIGADEFNPPSCPPVINPTADNAGAQSIVLQWIGGSGDFEYEIVMEGDPQGSGVRGITIMDSLRVGGLQSGTEYEYYVREICGRGDTSIWWGPISFETLDPIFDLSIDIVTQPVQLSEGCYGSNENIEVMIVNNGNVAIDFELDTTEVTVNVSGAATQSYSFEINDNSLNAGLPLAMNDTLLVSMGNIDMSNLGQYNFEFIVNMSADMDNSNDTLLSSITNSTSGGSLSANKTICGAGFAVLSSSGSMGDLQWQRMVNGVFTDETSADSVSYEVFIDSVTTFRLVACGTEFSDTLIVTPEAIPATPTTVNDTAIVFCGDTGTAVLTASASVSGSFNWYADSSSTTVLSTGSSYNYILGTSMQSVTTTYRDTFYVSVVDGISSCESEKAMVIGTVICTVGEEEIAESLNGIAVLPNPSNGVFNLIGYGISDNVQVSIFNSNGKLVYELEHAVSNNFNEQIDLSGMSKGMYYIKLQGRNSVEMKKLMLQ